MQQQNQSNCKFSERTDDLASKLGISLRELAGFVGISQAMLFAYRSGKEPVSEKAAHKLELAEQKAAYGKSELAVIQSDEIRAKVESGPGGVAREMDDAELIEAAYTWLKELKSSNQLWFKKAAVENLLIFVQELTKRIRGKSPTRP